MQARSILSRSIFALAAALVLTTLTAGPALAIDVCGNGRCCTWCVPAETPENCHADCYCPSLAPTFELEPTVLVTLTAEAEEAETQAAPAEEDAPVADPAASE